MAYEGLHQTLKKYVKSCEAEIKKAKTPYDQAAMIHRKLLAENFMKIALDSDVLFEHIGDLHARGEMGD